jgi:ABC-type uncharacterized transport system involved in gliding motility auxiliary subunit
MEQNVKMRRSIILLVLTCAVVIASVLVVERFGFRIDVSSDRTNTLSSVSRNLYKEIPEQVRITYYISSKLSSRYSGPRAIEDFLRSLESASKGRIVVEIEDPSSGKSQSDAQTLGISPQRMQIVENNEARVALVYSGIVVRYLDRTQVLPFILNTDTLEYDVVKAIRAAITDKKPIASILVGDGAKSLDNDFKYLSKVLEQSGWDKREISPGQEIPPETDVLVVLGNDALDDYDVYRIDVYLASGGKALFAVKGVDVQTMQGIVAQNLNQDAALRALETYGIKVARELVLDKSAAAIPYQTASPYGGVMISYARYPHWIVTRPENRDASNPLTAKLAGLDLFWPSPLEIVSRSGVESSALVKTTNEAWLQKDRYSVSLEEIPLYSSDTGSSTGQYILVASLSGVLPQAYAGKPVPKREGADPLPALPEHSRSSRILVVGSVEFATDYMTISGSEANASFIASAADWLASGDDIVALRSRGQRDTRFSKIKDAETKSALATLSYILNIGLVPAAVLAYGLVRAAKRRRQERDEASSRLAFSEHSSEVVAANDQNGASDATTSSTAVKEDK